MQHIDKIEKFFEFLEEHLESGFEKIKRTYSLSEYDEYYVPSNKEWNDTINKEFLVDESGYIHVNPYDGTEEYFDKKTYLNPVIKVKRVEVRTHNNLISTIEESFFNDLLSLYHKETKLVYRNLNKYLLQIQHTNTNEKIKIFIAQLNSYKIESNNIKYCVKDKKNNEIFLLSTWLQKLINKIEIKLLNEKDIASNEVEQKQFNEQKNKFNGMGIDKVREHFLQLTTSINKNKQPYLTESQLELFLEQVFIEGKTLEANKIDINYSNGAKKEIYRLFYEFYTQSISSIKIESSLNCKEKYVRLLTDNFNNFDYKKFSNNFNKYK